MIYLGVPTFYGMTHETTLNAVIHASKKRLVTQVGILGFSAPSHVYNQLFSNALNARKEHGITHFLMLHNDIGPENFWVDKLYDLMQEYQADILSVVVPLKDTRGLTSTALDESLDGFDPYWRPRRLTLHEVFNDYAPTFTHPKLLLNTGCMLIDLRKPWVNEMWFEYEDKIELIENKYTPRFQPEDWAFSRKARRLGASLYATRQVQLNHFGGGVFSNAQAWGSLQKDT